MIKLQRTAAVGVLYLALLVALYMAHALLWSVDVVLYGAMLDAVLAAALAYLLVLWLPYFAIFNSFEKLLLAGNCMLLGCMLAISVPAVIDRSLSFYILEKIQQRGGGILKNRLDEVFAVEYLREHRLIDVRLTEQLASGTIEIVDGCVLLTGRGQRLATFSRAFRTQWLPKRRLLMGQYSDDLTDPFRHSSTSPGYECRRP